MSRSGIHAPKKMIACRGVIFNFENKDFIFYLIFLVLRIPGIIFSLKPDRI
jgi:hypothetical protein